MNRGDLTNEQWARLEPLLPPQKPKTGRPNGDHRRLSTSMLWLLRTGAPWRDLPERYGPWGSIVSRFDRWRTIQIGDTPGELVTSYLILNLNEPNALGDVSWIEPGKYVGVWWEMHLGKSTWGAGPEHGATTENVKRYIDFAAEHGFKGVLVEGWNIGWDTAS